MKADISARTFRPQNHFAGVVVGQGQVLVDSAVNEQSEIDRYREQTATADIVGATGVPKQDGGFAITVSPDGHDLLVEPGRIYVGGVCCENEPAGVAATILASGGAATVVSVTSVASDGVPFAVGQWIDAVTTSTTRAQVTAINNAELSLGALVAGAAVGDRLTVIPVTSLRHQPDRLQFDPFAAGSPFLVAAGAHRVELDVWDRHISPVEVPSIREIALGDAESSTRIRTVWQVRLAPAGAVGAGSCALDPPPTRGTLAASTAPGLASDEPCVLPDEAGYRGLENQLYRVEVHSASSTHVVLKWSRDNASTASRILGLGSTLLLEDMGRDAERGFATGAFVEVTDDFLDGEQLPSDLIAVVGTPDPSERTLTLTTAPTRAQLNRNARARRWDGVITIDPTSPTAGTPVALERGVQVTLGPGALQPGDYWLIPGRTSNSAGGGTLIWPTDDSGAPLAVPPEGITHRRASLAIADADATKFLSGPNNLRECRTLFPPLTAIAASDVSIDPTPCGLGTGVITVQDAIDRLCKGTGAGCCTLSAVPGPGWESVFDKIAAGADASICFPLGDYPTPATVTVTGKGNIFLHGMGPGSRIKGSSGGSTLSFVNCAGVVAVSLAVTVLTSASGGLMTFANCGDVVLRHCRLSNGAAATNQGSCLRVTGGTVHVTDTTFAVGNLQAGIIAIDSARTVIEGCRFDVVALPITANNEITSATKLERLQARKLLVSGLKPTSAVSSQRVGVAVGNRTMSFGTPPAVRAAWATAINPAYGTMREFQRGLDKLMRSVFAGRVAVNAAAIEAFVADRIIARRTAVMAQAIVTGGRTVGDVRIADNQIANAVQGVHVGTSHRGSHARARPTSPAG